MGAGYAYDLTDPSVDYLVHPKRECAGIFAADFGAGGTAARSPRFAGHAACACPCARWGLCGHPATHHG